MKLGRACLLGLLHLLTKPLAVWYDRQSFQNVQGGISMIATKAQLKEYILWDSKANRRKSTACQFFGDECWKFQVAMRKLDYYSTRKKKNPLLLPLAFYYKLKYHRLGLRLGFSIPCDVAGKGLALPHYGTIVIAHGCHIGENCRIHEGVNMGATNGTNLAPTLGNNVFVGTGAKILGGVTVAHGVCIGANAVVTRSIGEENTTWAGIPAKKISDRSAKDNLAIWL